MNKSENEVYKEVQKNAEMAMKAIEIIQGKLADDHLSAVLTQQNMEYEKLRNKSLQKILQQKAEPYHKNVWNELMLKMGIHMNTFTNTSSSHIAELMIQGNSRGMAHLWKSLNMHGHFAGVATECAQELIDLEEKNIKALRDYL